MRRSRIGFDISDPRCAESSSQQIASPRTAHVVWWTVRFGVTLALSEWPKISARFSRFVAAARLFYELASWRPRPGFLPPPRPPTRLSLHRIIPLVGSIDPPLVSAREASTGGTSRNVGVGVEGRARLSGRPARRSPSSRSARACPRTHPRVCSLGTLDGSSRRCLRAVKREREASCSRSQSDVAPGGPSPRPAPHTSTSAELTSHERTTGSSAISRTAGALNTRSQSARSPGSTSEGKRAAAMGCRSSARFADRRLGLLRGSSRQPRAPSRTPSETWRSARDDGRE